MSKKNTMKHYKIFFDGRREDVYGTTHLTNETNGQLAIYNKDELVGYFLRYDGFVTNEVKQAEPIQ